MRLSASWHDNFLRSQPWRMYPPYLIVHLSTCFVDVCNVNDCCLRFQNGYTTGIIDLRMRSYNKSRNMRRNRNPMDCKSRTHLNSYRDAPYMRVFLQITEKDNGENRIRPNPSSSEEGKHERKRPALASGLDYFLFLGSLTQVLHGVCFSKGKLAQ
nr:hypothetical protein [Tanacetum cinerariifolium]